MDGISSKAAGIIDTKKKYNSYELNTDFDINLYESFYRMHDPQIGRFWQLDPKPCTDESPYVSMGNNPILHFDLLGDDFEIGTDAQSKEDVISLAKTNNKKYIKVSDKGKVTLDFGKKTKKEINKILAKDAGLKLISDLSVANEKYLYQASEISLYRSSDGERAATYTNATPHGVLNMSEYGKDSRDGNNERPKTGYEGQVVISPSAQWDEMNEEGTKIVAKNRNTVIFHELAENYERTTNGVNYNTTPITKGAHDKALDREATWDQRSRTSQPGRTVMRSKPLPNTAAQENYNTIMNNYRSGH